MEINASLHSFCYELDIIAHWVWLRVFRDDTGWVALCQIEEIRSKGFDEISVYELFGSVRSVISATPESKLQLFLIKKKFVIGVGGRNDNSDQELLMGVGYGWEVIWKLQYRVNDHKWGPWLLEEQLR